MPFNIVLIKLYQHGDFLIPLHPDLKKNKEAQKRVADAFSEMMKADLSKKPKSKAWV